MSFWKEKISGIVENLDNFADNLRRNWRTRRGYRKKLKIISYLGFGTNDKFYLRGRVVAENNEVLPAQTDNKRRNLKNFFRRFFTDEVPFARVRVKFQDFETDVTADGEGYFYVEANNVVITESDALFREIDLELLAPVSKTNDKTRAIGKVLIPPPTAKFGIISDLDDTVITTDVTRKLKMLFNTAFRNEYTRLPFKGVAQFYQALQKGANNDQNPFFYVSSSPWNLYPFLVEFLRLNEIPTGAIFLKDFGSHTIFNSSAHAVHKIEHIEKILNAYPHLTFILIGDDGESDPQIYAEIVRRFPAKIKVIYIRSNAANAAKHEDLKHLIVEVAKSKVQLILAEDTEFAAVHAAAENLIDADELENIRIGKQTDEKPLPAKEKDFVQN